VSSRERSLRPAIASCAVSPEEDGGSVLAPARGGTSFLFVQVVQVEKHLSEISIMSPDRQFDLAGVLAAPLVGRQIGNEISGQFQINAGAVDRRKPD